MSDECIIPAGTAIGDALRAAVKARRMIFVAGLPSSGKSLMLQQLTILAHQAGRRIHSMQWDGARRAFETPEWLAKYPEVNDLTHPGIRKAVDGVDDDLLREAYDADWALHNGLIAAMNNDVLSDVHRLNTDKVRLIRLNARFTPSRVLPAMREHIVIIDALLEKRFEDAASAMSEHLHISEGRSLGVESGLV